MIQITPLGPAHRLLAAMADSGIPTKLSLAIRVAIFWIAVPFVGVLLGLEDIRKGEYLWGIGLFAIAILSIVISVYWEIFFQKKEAKPTSLEYLRNEDSELGGAIRDMVWRSAWAKWYTAQFLAMNNHRQADEGNVMQVATSIVLDALTDGRLEARGRKPGQLEYEPIPRTHWRSSALHMVKDNKTLWRMILIPRGGAEISPEGAVTGHDAAATQRTGQLATYDSLIVNSRQFENLWPRKDKKTDAARKRLLKAAKKAGADPTEIKKLSQD